MVKLYVPFYNTIAFQELAALYPESQAMYGAIKAHMNNL